VHADADVRHAVLELVTTTPTVSKANGEVKHAPPAPLDRHVVAAALRLTLDEPAPRYREPRLHALRRFFGRCADALRRAAPASSDAVTLTAYVREVAAVLLRQLYPGAPMPRVHGALDAWAVLVAALSGAQLGSVHAQLVDALTVRALWTALAHDYDRVRTTAYTALTALTAPLPGLTASVAVCTAVQAAVDEAWSARP